MSTAPDPASDEARAGEILLIQEALRGLRFGSVNIVVQDGVIVQIDRTEKRRVIKPDAVRP